MMKPWTIATCTTITLAVIGAWLIPGSALAVAPVRVNGDYASSPPFVSNIATPNILILMDNSGSMSNRACETASCGILSTGATSTVTTFTNTTTYSGYFNSLTCYTYNITDNRFEASGAQRATVATGCSTTTWDGNFLNWSTFRRFDALKRALTGGDCTVTRASAGTCPTTGSPALKTITAQVTGVSVENADVNYGGGTGANTYVGRIPSVDRGSNPSTIYIGTDDGYFCVDNDNSFNSNCGDSFSQRKYFLKVGYSTEPTGIIQQVGSKARFGLSVFNPSSTDDGMRVLSLIHI